MIDGFTVFRFRVKKDWGGKLCLEFAATGFEVGWLAQQRACVLDPVGDPVDDLIDVDQRRTVALVSVLAIIEQRVLGFGACECGRFAKYEFTTMSCLLSVLCC